jgi:hypothetical protein
MTAAISGHRGMDDTGMRRVGQPPDHDINAGGGLPRVTLQ